MNRMANFQGNGCNWFFLVTTKGMERRWLRGIGKRKDPLGPPATLLNGALDTLIRLSMFFNYFCKSLATKIRRRVVTIKNPGAEGWCLPLDNHKKNAIFFRRCRNSETSNYRLFTISPSGVSSPDPAWSSRWQPRLHLIPGFFESPGCSHRPVLYIPRR